MVRYQVRVYWLFCFCVCVAAAGVASSYALEAPPPKPAQDPLTIAFAKATPPKGACDAINMRDGDSTSEDSDQYADDGWKRIKNHFEEGFGPPGYPMDQAARNAMMAKDKDNLIQCQRDASAYFAFGALELELVQAKDKKGSAARALAALDVAIEVSSDCAGRPPAAPPCCYDCHSCEGCSSGDECAPVIAAASCGTLRAYRAASLAELGRAEDAFMSLQAAIDGGFSAISWISRGDLMAKLRTHPEWDARLDAMLTPRFPPLREVPTADLGYSSDDGYRSATYQVLCRDHRVFFIGYSVEGMGWSVGRWELKPDGVWVTMEKECDDYTEEGVIRCDPMRVEETAQRMAFSAVEARVLFQEKEAKKESPCSDADFFKPIER